MLVAQYNVLPASRWQKLHARRTPKTTSKMLVARYNVLPASRWQKLLE